MRTIISILVLTCLAVGLNAQAGHRELREGDKAYRQGEFEKAADSYRDAITKKNSAQGNYNLGNAAYEQEDYEEAARRFEEAAILSDNPSQQAYAFHNLGNAYYQQGEYQKAAEAYMNALRRAPTDMETKHNLAKALQMEQMQQQQQQQQSEEQNEEQEEQENQQDQQQQQQQDQQQQQQDQQNQQQQEPSDPQENQQQQQQQQQPMTREEAERQLQFAEEDEKKTMEKLQRINGRTCTSDKKW